MDGTYEIRGTVLDLFRKQVKFVPDLPAIVYENESLSYRELEENSNRLARLLLLQDVKPDSPVGLCLNRSIDMVVAIFAIIKIGAAYMPLDPYSPALRLEAILDNSGSLLVLSEQKWASKFHNYSGELIFLDAISEQRKQQSYAELDVSVLPSNLMYVLHTSGTTGIPKGVAVEHKTLMNLTLWHKQILKDEGLRTLAFASFHFDVSAQELFSTCCTGGTLFIVSEETRVLPEKLVDYVHNEKIERIFMPFTPLNYFFEAVLNSKKKLSDLKRIITAGETLLVNESMRKFFRVHANCIFQNHYGPTETHVATSYELNSQVDDWPDKPSIGKPITNAQVYILNENLLPTNHKEQGEIFIGGICPARGYLNQAELSRQKFIPDPFSDTEESVMYRTGDIGCLQQNGNIEFIGRADLQVKIRGFRIELSEIEATLMEHPSIKLAAVQVVAQEFKPKQLVAYIEFVAGKQTGIFELRSFLAARLPDYMLPHLFVFMEKFPITENGKLDRNKLPPPDSPVSTMDYVEPVNEIQSELAAIWGAVLNLNKVGINDNFFVLGGDSLLAARVLLKIESSFCIDLSLAEFYESTTIALIGNLLEQKIEDKKKQEELLLLQLLDQVENMTEAEVKAELSSLNK